MLLILATWASIALGVARHRKLGISTGVITQLGKGVDGGEHTVLTVVVKPTSPTESCFISNQHWLIRPILCIHFYIYNEREHHPKRAHAWTRIIRYALGKLCCPHQGYYR